MHSLAELDPADHRTQFVDQALDTLRRRVGRLLLRIPIPDRHLYALHDPLLEVRRPGADRLTVEER
ncbi:hypothetical protein ACR6C2_39865 [Streptomyces sp. INA 01156]